jgi:O-antigen/teichoic acid export membrane protein
MSENQNQGILQSVTNLFSKVRLSSLKRLVKDEVGLVYTTLGGFGSSALGALFWLILASLLTVDNYGLANYYISLSAIFSGLSIIGLNMTVTTFLAKGEKNILYEANSLALISGLLVGCVLSVFEWAAGLLSIATVFFTMALAEALGKKNYKEYAIVQVGQKLLQLVLSILLYYQLGIIGIILGYFVGYIVFSYKYFFSLRKFTVNFSIIKEKRNFTIHSCGYNLIGGSLSNYLDKIIIGPLFGYYMLGLYQLGFQFFMFLSLIPMSLQQYLLPEESSGNDKKSIKTLSVVVSALASVAVFAASPFLINSFFPNFTDAILLVGLMSLAVIPATVSSILTASLLGNEKSKTVFISGVLYVVSLVSALVILGSVMGVTGLAVAVIIAKSIQAGYLVIKRK